MNWCAHLANHRVRVLWRFHELHHSQEDMSVMTVFRTHPLIHVSYLIALLPGIVLLANGALPTTLLVLYGGVVAFAHSNTNLGFGPLGRIFVSPNYHRIHHKLDGPQDVNLGFALTIWDQLFRRAVFPTDGDHPDRHRTPGSAAGGRTDGRATASSRRSSPLSSSLRSARCTSAPTSRPFVHRPVGRERRPTAVRPVGTSGGAGGSGAVEEPVTG